MKLTLSVKETAELLGVSTDSVYAMVRERQIPFVRIRRRILFHQATIEGWLQGQFETRGDGNYVQ